MRVKNLIARHSGGRVRVHPHSDSRHAVQIDPGEDEAAMENVAR